MSQVVHPVPDTGGAAGGPPGPRDGGGKGGLVVITPSWEQPTVRVLPNQQAAPVRRGTQRRFRFAG